MIPDDNSNFGNCTDLQGMDFGDPDSDRTILIMTVLSESEGISQYLYYPIDFQPVYITQGFGGNHYGLDIGLRNGTKLYNPLPVRAQIVKLGWDNSGYGIMVGLKNDEYGLYVILAHMDRINPDLRIGDWIDPFAFIGWSDSTGNSTGPHLHLEVRRKYNGYYPYPSSCINPRPLLQWFTQSVPPPTPPPPPNPNPKWYRVRATKELSLYTKQNLRFVVSWPKIASGAIIRVQDRKRTATQEWVILENGFFALKRNKRKILLVEV